MVISNVKCYVEIFKMNKKNVIARFLILNPLPVLNYLRFLAKWSRNISADLILTQYLYFKMLRTMSSLCVLNFSLRGRRSKGKVKRIRARDHARGRREEGNFPFSLARPNSPFPFPF